MNQILNSISGITNIYWGSSAFLLSLLIFLISFYLYKTAKNLSRAGNQGEKHFIDAFNYAGIGMAIVGLDGRWQKVNPALCSITGYTGEELLKMTFHEIVHRDDLGTSLAFHRQMLSGDIPFYHMEKRYIHKSGQIVWIFLSISMVCDTYGKPLYLVAQIQDIIQKKTAEELMRESEEKYRNLVEQSMDGIMLVDKRGTLVEFNRGMEIITGVRKEEALGRPETEVFFRILPQEHKKSEESIKIGKASMQDINDASRKSQGQIFESILQCPDGTRRNIQDLRYPVRTKKGTYTCCITRDITEQKKVEELKIIAREKEKQLKEALEYEKLRTEFFANLSHEFRTPLNMIFTSIQLMGKYIHTGTRLTAGEAKVAKLLKTSTQNCYRLMRLINNMIDVTRIDSGSYELKPVNCDIVAILEDITLSVAEYVKARNLNLAFDTDVEEKVMACDPEKVERILLNLLSNAIKFTAPGGNIFVNVINGRRHLVFSVRDTGIGIPESKLGQIFERLVQVDKSLTRAHEGSGIGLSLVRSLVELHKGSITVQSKEGEGTSFIVKLPVGLPASNAKGNSDSSDREKNYAEKVSVEFSDIYL